MRTIKLGVIVAGLFVSACTPPSIQADRVKNSIQNSEIIPYPQNAETFYLENGLEVLAIQNSSSPMVALNMTIRVGSAFENYSTSGMSHMLEHLLFNGTETRTQDKLYEDTDLVGAYSNAFTGKQFTDFIFLLPSEYIEQGMDIQQDMIFHSIIPSDKLEKERGIVIEEILKDRDSETYHVQNFFNRMNLGYAGAGLPTLGTKSTIEHMKRDDIFEFYKDHYVPNNMILTIIGNFDSNQLKPMLEKYYGDEPPKPIFQNPIENIQFDNTKMITNIDYQSVSKNYAQLVYNFETKINNIQFDEISKYLLVHFMNEEITSLFTENELSFSINNDGDIPLLIADFTTNDESHLPALSDKIQLAITDFYQQLTYKTNLAQKIKVWVTENQVEDFAYLDQPHYYAMMKASDLAQNGGRWILEHDYYLNNYKLENLKQSLSSLTQLSPLQFNIVLSKKSELQNEGDSRVLYDKSVLPSGATLITASGGGSPMFGMHVMIKNRNNIEGNLTGGAEILHTLLESGTDTYSSDELKLELGKIGAQTKYVDMGFIPYDNYYNSPEYGYIRFECLEKDAKRGIELLTHMMDYTTLTDDNVQNAVSQAMGKLQMQGHSSRNAISSTFWKLFLGENNPITQKVSGNTESVSLINKDNLTQLQSKYFSPENYVITISSNIPHNELVDTFNSIWSTKGNPVERIVEPILPQPQFQEKIIELGKEQSQIKLGYTFTIKDEDKPVFSLMTDILSYRMMMDLRESQGLAYSIGLSEGYEGNTAWLVASIGTGVENIDKVVKELKSYFNPAKLVGITQDEITRTVNSNKGAYMRRNLTRIGQAFYMGYYEFFTGDYENALNRYSNQNDINVEDIQHIANTYLKLPENHTIVITK